MDEQPAAAVPPSPPLPFSPSPRRFNLPKKLHLRSKKDFDAVFDARTKESRGPLSVHARPNGLAFPRLGMSVSRKVGNAVKRNRIRRLIREAFRLMQHDWPAGYDLVTVVRPHAPLPLAEYQRILAGTVAKLHVTFTKRAAQLTPVSERTREDPDGLPR